MARRSGTRRGGRGTPQGTSGPNGTGRSVKEIFRTIALPEIREAGKGVIAGLSKGDEPILDPRFKGVAQTLLDLTCNITNKVLERPPEAPVPNPFEGMSDQEIMDELARRTGREILMMPSENGSPTSETIDPA